MQPKTANIFKHMLQHEIPEKQFEKIIWKKETCWTNIASEIEQKPTHPHQFTGLEFLSKTWHNTKPSH